MVSFLLFRLTSLLTSILISCICICVSEPVLIYQSVRYQASRTLAYHTSEGIEDLLFPLHTTVPSHREITTQEHTCCKPYVAHACTVILVRVACAQHTIVHVEALWPVLSRKPLQLVHFSIDASDQTPNNRLPTVNHKMYSDLTYPQVTWHLAAQH